MFDMIKRNYIELIIDLICLFNVITVVIIYNNIYNLIMLALIYS